MIYGLKVDLPALAGAKRIVEVPGLGTVVNPGTYEVPEELLLQFESTHGYPLEEANFQDGVELVLDVMAESYDGAWTVPAPHSSSAARTASRVRRGASPSVGVFR